MYHEGEYLVIQTYPTSQKLKVVGRSFNYQEARSNCEIENLGHDSSNYGLRIYHENKLWDVNFDGTTSYLSQEQFWEIHSEYQAAARDENAAGDIEVHDCSYPYYAVPMTRFVNFSEAVLYTGVITCLIEDNGRSIENCPNCGERLVDWEEDEEDEEESEQVDWEEDEEDEEDEEEVDEQGDIPTACQGCQNYHGNWYGDTVLICAIHPYGCGGDNCPDYQSSLAEQAEQTIEPSATVSASPITSQNCDLLVPEPVSPSATVINSASTALTINQASPNSTLTRNSQILTNSYTVPQEVVQERLRHHQAGMRRLLLFARIDSLLSALAGVCFFGASLCACATLAAFGMNLIAKGGVKQAQGVAWDNTVKVTAGAGLMAGAGAAGCGVLACAFSVIEQRTRP